MQLRDHTFLVTGGGSGLGEACVRRFVAAGGRIVIADVNEQAGAALAAELGEAARFIKTDVTREDDVQRAVETATREFGGLRGVVCCAGIVIGQRVLGKDGPHPLGAFAKLIEVNLIGTFNVIRLAAAQMATQPPEDDDERGVIITTASVAALEGQIGQAAYSASKAGVAGMTLPIARELARFGIRVMTIAPGTFDTPMMAGMPDALRKSLADQVPFPRLGHPDEYAALAQHIIENRMLNGELIRLDGAIRMGAK